MSIPLEVLIVEDSENDAELLVYQLQSNDFDPRWTRVDTEAAYVAQLEKHFDVVFSDFSLPKFSGQRALKILREHKQDIPFIIVSGTIGEERAVEALRLGATDYVLKHRIENIGTILRRALREAEDRAERKRAEEFLEESERRFREMLENLELIAVTLDNDGKVTFCNDFLLRLTGWNREDVLGKDWFSLFIPETDVTVKKLFRERIHFGKIPSHYENPIKTRKGMIREIVWSNTTLRDAAGEIIGTASIGEDVTERKRAEEALRESEAKFRQLAENIHEVFWMTDPTGTQMLYISPAYEKIWGRTCESLRLAPKSWLEAIHPEDRERISQAIAMKRDCGEFDEIYRIVRPDGAVRWIHDRAFPIRDRADRIYRIVGTAEDVTQQRDLEQQFRQAQKMESIGQLAGGVAHDFNNLLTVINSYSQVLLESGELTPDSAEMLNEVFTAGERAANLTRQLLTFSRKQPIRTEQIDLNEVVSDVASLLRRLIGENIEMKLNLAKNLPRITADAGMIDQVLMNLAVNGRDAMTRGGCLAINTSLAEIKEPVAKQNSDSRAGVFVCLTVQDSGSGMSPEILSHIFEPFFTTKEIGKGTGLGLATVFGIVKQHNGWIEVETKIDSGTAFKIFLPIVSQVAAQSGETSRPARPLGGTETILLVEDEEAVRGMAVLILKKHGYRALEAVSGPDALRVWKGHPGKIDLLLTDMVMPGGMTGSELAGELKKSNSQIKVIYTSGYSAEMSGEGSQSRDKIPFLQKPYHTQRLIRTIRACLDEKLNGN